MQGRLPPSGLVGFLSCRLALVFFSSVFREESSVLYRAILESYSGPVLTFLRLGFEEGWGCPLELKGKRI